MKPLAAFDQQTIEMATQLLEWERERALMDWKMAAWRFASGAPFQRPEDLRPVSIANERVS